MDQTWSQWSFISNAWSLQLVVLFHIVSYVAFAKFHAGMSSKLIVFGFHIVKNGFQLSLVKPKSNVVTLDLTNQNGNK